MTSVFRRRVSVPLIGLSVWLGAWASELSVPFGPEPSSASVRGTDFIHLRASDAEPGAVYGAAVALSRDGNTLAVGADLKGTGTGAVYVHVRTPEGWVQQARLEAVVPTAGSGFGFSVSLSDDGRRLAVGAPFESLAGTEQGAAYLFDRHDNAWTMRAHLKASNARDADWFGSSLALSGEGSTLAVGARHEDGPAARPVADSGAVYVFEQRADGWSEQAYLKAGRAQEGDRFGASLALSAHGDTLAVGSQSLVRGTVGVFARTPSGWAERAVLQSHEAVARDRFGAQLALSADGDTLAVGAAGSLDAAGVAHVYAHQGGRWLPQAQLRASQAQPGDAFGERLALSADGSVLAVSAIHGAQAREAGVVHLFERGASTWRSQQHLTSTHPGSGNLFGSSLGLSGDGRLLAVGARLEDGPRAWSLGGLRFGERAQNSGAVYLQRTL